MTLKTRKPKQSKSIIHFELTVEGVSEADIEQVIREALRRYENGATTAGFDANNTGAFDYGARETTVKDLAW